jgi:hypothetical protein
MLLEMSLQLKLWTCGGSEFQSKYVVGCVLHVFEEGIEEK